MGFTDEISKCIKVLKSGGTLLYPTDTIWGIGCDATNLIAIRKVYDIKHRPGHKAMIILLSDVSSIYNYIAEPPQSIFEYLRTVVKPTTVIYTNAINLPREILGAENSIAIRIVKDPFCKTLIDRFNKPLISTSANISGNDSPQNFIEIHEEIKESVDYIVKYRQNDLSPKQPSSLIRVNEKGGIEVIRP